MWLGLPGLAVFTFLVRARDILPISQVLVNECHLSIASKNYDSEKKSDQVV